MLSVAFALSVRYWPKTDIEPSLNGQIDKHRVAILRHTIDAFPEKTFSQVSCNFFANQVRGYNSLRSFAMTCGGGVSSVRKK
jgi:hypothetical protein